MPRAFFPTAIFLLLLLPFSESFPHPPTVPATPERSSAACPLDIPDNLLRGIAAACSPTDSNIDYRRRCCPALAASLHAAHAAAALAVPSPASDNGRALPDPPDDSEACAVAAEVALRARGVELRRPNETCDVAHCYCGVRLPRLRCPGPFVPSPANWRWVPADEDTATRVATECSFPGLDGCTRCLHALYQLTRKGEEEGPRSNATAAASRRRECQLMGLTWLIAENQGRYLHVAALVLRAFMASPDDVDPATCSVPGDGDGDDIPLPVDSGWFSATAIGLRSSSTFRCALSLFLLTMFIHAQMSM
ncbi:GPI-anchored protein [Canna indica]|uniref:GPI-anchored protein n=1 Tax=Canna indica TaxID=4628 RepID=A0AAQ3K211_9LILI|nr:GPI-anchored protein [Canna indica]